MSEESRDDMVLIKQAGMRDVIISLWLRVPKDHIITNNEEKAKAKFAEYKDRVNRLAKGKKE